MFSFGRTTITTSAAHTTVSTVRAVSNTNTTTSSQRPQRPLSAPPSPSRLSRALSRVSLSYLRLHSFPEGSTKPTSITTTPAPLPRYPHITISGAMSIHSVLRTLRCTPETHDPHPYTYPVLLDFIMHVLHTSEVPYAIAEHIIALFPRYHAYALVHYERTTLSGHELFFGLLVLLAPYYKEKFAEKAKFTNEFWTGIAGVTSFHGVHMLHVYMRLDGVLGSLFVDLESLPKRQDVQFELPQIVV